MVYTTDLLRVLGRVCDVPVVVWRAGRVRKILSRCGRLLTEPRVGCSPFLLLRRPSALTLRESRGGEGRGAREEREEKERALHDASMLWSVTQTAITLNTGDHSVPRMDAQICSTVPLGTGSHFPEHEGETYVSVRVYVLEHSIMSGWTDLSAKGHTGCTGVW